MVNQLVILPDILQTTPVFRLLDECAVLVLEHLQVVLQDLLRQPLEHPLMVKSFQGRHPLDRVPLEAAGEEVEKLGIVDFGLHLPLIRPASEHLRERLGTRIPDFTF